MFLLRCVSEHVPTRGDKLCKTTFVFFYRPEMGQTFKVVLVYTEYEWLLLLMRSAELR